MIHLTKKIRIFSLVGGFMEMYEYFLASQFLWHLSSICGALLILQMEMVRLEISQ